MQCKRCNQVIPFPKAHSKGCAVTPAPSNPQLDNIVDMLGGVMKNQEALNSRLSTLENAGFKPREEPTKEQVVRTLETNLDIVKSLHQEGKKEMKEEVPVCHSGIHYPSDFGQKRENGEGSGPLTPPLRKCFPATGALRQLVDSILGPEFQVDCLPDLYNSTFILNIIVPPKYCVYEDYRSGKMKDVRAITINNMAAEQETRTWCERVKKKITQEHQSFQLPSPFTMPSMNAPMATVLGRTSDMTSNSNANYTVKQL